MTPSPPRVAATGLLVALVLAATNMFLLALPSVEPTLTGVAAPTAYFAPAPRTSALESPADSQPVVATVDPPQTVRAAMRATTGWVHPLPGYCLRGYGMRTHPITGAWKMHNGADSRGASYGTPIRAAHAGTARHGWESGGAGTYVTVQGEGVATAYFHMSSRAVGDGARVDAGQVIGYVGSTGASTGPHLHFEVHPWGLWNGRTDPVAWMAQRGVQIGCA